MSQLIISKSKKAAVVALRNWKIAAVLAVFYSLNSLFIGSTKLFAGHGELRIFIFIPALTAVWFGPVIGGLAAGFGNLLLDIIDNVILKGESLDMSNVVGFFANLIGAYVVGLLRDELIVSKDDNILSLKFFKKYFRNLVASVIGAHIVSGYTPLSLSFVWPAKTGREPTIQALLRQIPDNAPISAEMHLAAHLAARETLRLFPDLRDAEWIVIDAWFGGDPYGSFVNTWQGILQDPTWETVAAHDGLILLHKGLGPPQAIEGAFQPSDTLVLPPLDAWFGRTEDGLQLRGLNIYCRAAGLCYLCLEGIKTGASPLMPRWQSS